MKINIIIFGQLCEILGDKLVLDNIMDTNQLVKELNKRYPEIATSDYVVAVNKKLIINNTVLTDNSTVALLPPFSGG